jgi:hypothetical protein
MPGVGGFGTVWQVNLKGKEVAVKQLYMSKRNAYAGDFIREVIVLGTMAHPNIVGSAPLLPNPKPHSPPPFLRARRGVV